MKKILTIGLLVLFVAVSLTITMAAAAPDTSPTVAKPAAIATVDEAESVNETTAAQEVAPIPLVEVMETEPEEVAPVGDTCQSQCAASMAVQNEANNNLADQIQDLQKQIDTLKAK